MNNSITQTRPALDFVKKLVLEHPGATISTALAALLVPWCIGNYRKFYALGHSGLGQGIGGWFIATLVTLTFGRETLTTAEYDRDPNKETFLKDLASIPERRGSRPEIGWHCIPHRQMSRLPTNKTITDDLDARFYKLAKTNAHLTKVVLSPHEKTIDAMIIDPSIPSPHKTADYNLREINHVHVIDHSVHVVCSPQDCKFIIERGWGERQALSGVCRLIPLSKEYLLIYAPRDEEELSVIERIMAASIGFMTNSHDVQF